LAGKQAAGAITPTEAYPSPIVISPLPATEEPKPTMPNIVPPDERITDPPPYPTTAPRLSIPNIVRPDERIADPPM
jgi:hypothetical protein